MKKVLILLLLIGIILSCTNKTEAQTKIIKKTVKKVVTPQIAPMQPPSTAPTPEAIPSLDAPPPPPPPPRSYEIEAKEDKGLLGWGLNTDLGAKLLYGSILFGVRGDIVFDDPLTLGEKIGLAEDAVEYKLGLGFVMSDKLKSIPLFADAIVYLKEGSLMGMDPYIGTGLIFNLYGTGKVSGGLGGQIYLGILADLGLGSRTGLTLGYATYKVGDNLHDSGLFVTIAQPFKL